MAMTFTTKALREIAEQPVGTGHERSMAIAWLAEREEAVEGYKGYFQAFYRIVELLDIGAQPMPPVVVFTTMILPRLRAALAAEMPRPMTSAPRDGTMLRLLVQFDEHATEDTTGPAWTIGANELDANGIDEWSIAGWCWSHDHFTAGKGTPIGWLPLLGAAPDSSRGAR